MRKRRILLTFSSLVVLYILAAIGIAAAVNMQLVTGTFPKSAIYAIALNAANTVVAVFLFELSVKKGNKIFILLNLGGMVLRLFIMLILVIISLKFLKIDVYEFILVFFVFYFIQLIIEILHFSKYRALVKTNED